VTSRRISSDLDPRLARGRGRIRGRGSAQGTLACHRRANIKLKRRAIIVSINDLSYFSTRGISRRSSNRPRPISTSCRPNFSYRIAGSPEWPLRCPSGEPVLAEPSTRTRALVRKRHADAWRRHPTSRRSGDQLGPPRAKASPSSVRVIANYLFSTVIVSRHPRDAAARLAADYSPVPVDQWRDDGAMQYPTQTLLANCSPLKKKKHIKNLKIRHLRDLRDARDHCILRRVRERSWAQHMPMPRREWGCRHGGFASMREEFRLQIVPGGNARRRTAAAIDALYVTR